MGRKRERGQKQGIGRRIFFRKRTCLLFAAPVSAALLELAKRNGYFAEEIFAKRIFKALSTVISFLTGWLPFSVAELSLIVCPFAAAALFIWYIKRLVTEKEDRFFLCLNGIYSALCLLSLIFTVYAFGCGMNYYRYPFAYYAGLTVEPSDTEALYEVCKELAERANALRAELGNEDENGVYRLPVTKKELAKLAKEAYEALAETYPIVGGTYPAPKRVLLSDWMSYTELTGIYTCWTMEANVNVAIPDYSIGSTMTHELAHLRGFIREDEANYLSYLACLASESKDLQYSGVMEALILSGNELYKRNPERYFEVRAAYCAGIERDLAANSAYWAAYHNTPVSKATDRANDTYLKANNQADGVQSYGRMVDLLIAEYKKRKETGKSW